MSGCAAAGRGFPASSAGILRSSWPSQSAARGTSRASRKALLKLETPAVATPLGPDKLRTLTDPANYLGAAPAMVNHLLTRR